MIAAVAMLFASCDKYDNVLSDIENRLDRIEESSLTTIDQQIAVISASINDLKAMDTELGGYISALQTTATDLQSQIDATNAEIDNVKKEMGNEIDAVEQSLLNKLDNLKTTLEGELATIKANIEALTAKDTELEGKIAALETYVNNQLQATEDWVNATFATLAQYQEVLTTIAGIKSDITAINSAMADLETRINNKIATDIKAAIDALRVELGADYVAKIEAAINAVTSAYTDSIATAKTEIEAAYTKAIADAIAASEASMKAWVNGEIQKVYAEIADMEAYLAALAASVATDEELAAAVAAQQDELKQAKNDLIAAYEAAIKKAIEDNNGVINDAIAAAIATATNNLQSEIDSIMSKIAYIKERLDELEDTVGNLASRIQSIRFLPEYSDGKVELNSDNAPVTLTFLLSPNETAKAVAKAFARNNRVVTAYLSLTQERSRAVSTPTQINVTKVTGTADGVLTVEVNAENLPADYWATAENANLFIHISDGNNDVISEMIPTFCTVICELPDGYDFREAVHAQLADDTNAIKFITNSKVVTEHQIGTSHAYMQLNGTTLEIHTAAKEFIFNKDCVNMFSTFNNSYTKFENITTIDFNGCINTSKVTNMDYMFFGCKALKSLDLSSFNTANVTNMSYMFDYCQALESLNLSSFNTANVTNMSCMFNQCMALKSLDLSSFNTANVTDMASMFQQCYALESLDLSSFNTANVENMNSMFYSCTALESLDLSSFNTANVENMNSMFYSCLALESLNLSSFNTANVTSMRYMFASCTALESLNLSSFNTANVTNMSCMFNQCMALKSLDLSNFNTANVANMSSMFYRCVALESLNLSSFNTANVTDMGRMFHQCYALNSLDLSSFNTANVTNMADMFNLCMALNLLDIQNFDMGKVTDSSNMFLSVGKSYYNATGNRTPIHVTMALMSVLESMNVSTDSYAEYFIVDNLPG